MMNNKQTCECKKIVSHNWELFKKNNYWLILIKKMKYGLMYKCQQCQKEWLIDEKYNLAHLIKPEHKNIIHSWNSEAIHINKTVQKNIKHIKPTIIYEPNSTAIKHLEIPCSCIVDNNNEIDFCIIVFVRHPVELLNTYKFKQIFLANSLISANESRFILPYSIRLATTQATEIRMQFRPTQIISRDQKSFLLNGKNNFFSYEDYLGQEMKLSKKMLNEDELIYYQEKSEDITFIISDFDQQQL